MIYEFKGICQNCATEYKTLMVNSKIQGDCQECGEPPLKAKRFKGLIYVVNNPHQTGVKVGLTTKSVDQRLKSLNSTGVAGKFSTVVIFPSDRPETDEKKAHAKLKKYSLSKEHFDTSPVDAALCVYRALNYRSPIFYDSEVEEEFYRKLEEDRRVMSERLKGNSSTPQDKPALGPETDLDTLIALLKDKM